MIIKSVQPWFSVQEESNLNSKFSISKLRNYVYNAKLWILTCMTFLCVLPPRNNTEAHTFIRSFEDVNGGLSQERLLRSRNFGTRVTWYSAYVPNAITSFALRKKTKQDFFFFQTCVNLSASLSLHLTVCLKVFASDGVNLNTINWK